MVCKKRERTKISFVKLGKKSGFSFPKIQEKESKTPQTTAMASSTLEKGVFVDTNLGTHLAIAVSPEITAREFKSKNALCVCVYIHHFLLLIQLSRSYLSQSSCVIYSRTRTQMKQTIKTSSFFCFEVLVSVLFCCFSFNIY